MYRSIVLFEKNTEWRARESVKALAFQGELCYPDINIFLDINTKDVSKLINDDPTADLVIVFSDSSLSLAQQIKNSVSNKPVIVVDLQLENSCETIERDILKIENKTFNLIEDNVLTFALNTQHHFSTNQDISDYLKGTWAISNNSPSPYHLFFDVLGPYLEAGITETISGLFVPSTDDDSQPKNINDFLKKYCNAIFFKHTFEQTQESFTIEKTIKINKSDANSFLQDGSPETFPIAYDGPVNQNRLIKKYALLIKSFLLNKISSLPGAPTKVFLADTKLKDEFGARNISDTDYYLIINYFKNKGYEIINQSSMPLDEQLGLVMGATHVAAFAGSVSALSLACSKETNFILINPSKEYIFPHPRLIKQSCNLLYFPTSCADTIAMLEEVFNDRI